MVNTRLFLIFHISCPYLIGKINETKTVSREINELSKKVNLNVIYLQSMIDYICDGVDSNDTNMSNQIYLVANKADSNVLRLHGRINQLCNKVL